MTGSSLMAMRVWSWSTRPPIILAEYGFKQRQGELERTRLARLRHTPAVTMDGLKD
jgi:hypothetical protein